MRSDTILLSQDFTPELKKEFQELEEYKVEVAKNMGLSEEYELFPILSLEMDGFVGTSKNGKCTIGVNLWTLRKKKRIIRHELGHEYILHKRPKLNRFLSIISYPYDFNKNLNEKLTTSITLVGVAGIILNVLGRTEFFNLIPSSLIGNAILGGGNYLRERFADYFGSKFSRKQNYIL